MKPAGYAPATIKRKMDAVSKVRAPSHEGDRFHSPLTDAVAKGLLSPADDLGVRCLFDEDQANGG